MPEISQVILNGSTLMSVTSDTVTPEHVENGYTFHAANGALCTGNMNPGGNSAIVNVIPYTTAQTILPPSGYDSISQINVAPIAYTEVPNEAGGLTITIGTMAPII